MMPNADCTPSQIHDYDGDTPSKSTNDKDQTPQSADEQIMAAGWQGCGLNAHGQVNGKLLKDAQDTQDLCKIPKMTSFSRVIFAKWAYTIVWLVRDTTLFKFGLHKDMPTGHRIALGIPDLNPYDARDEPVMIGTDLELLGAIARGSLFSYQTAAVPSLIRLNLKKGHRILRSRLPSRVDRFVLNGAAVTHTGRTALLATNEDYHGSGSRVIEADDFATLAAWYEDRDVKTSTVQIRTFKTRLIGITAGATAFVAWNEAGEVYTWGDERHGHELGRIPTLVDTAKVPTIMPYLHGLKIEKVVAQGSVYVALDDKAGALYIWGGHSAVDEIQDEQGKFQLLDIANGKRSDSNDEDEDEDDADADDEDIVKLVPFKRPVRNVALGLAHMVIRTRDNVIYAIGDNRYHQLPYTTWRKEPTIIREWRDCGINACSLACGPLTTFIGR